MLLLLLPGLLQVLPSLWEEGSSGWVLQHHPLGAGCCWWQWGQLGQAAQ
jgi:hypothetical protein